MDKDRLKRVRDAQEMHGWFEGDNGIAEAMALPQTVEEIIALLRVVGVHYEAGDSVSEDSDILAIATLNDGRVRCFSDNTYPFDDPWIRPAALLHCAMYDKVPFPGFHKR